MTYLCVGGGPGHRWEQGNQYDAIATIKLIMVGAGLKQGRYKKRSNFKGRCGRTG